MPKRSGTEVCREVRKTLQTPIIMLTAKGEEIDRILGLELGADDYIVKPFSPREVIARIKAVLRRFVEKNTGGQILDLKVSRSIWITTRSSLTARYVPCTPKEVEILHLLASNPGLVFDRDQILTKVWGYDYIGDTRTVDTHIKRIRHKLHTEESSWALITVYGVGYKFESAS